jgi:hypothetical protein
MNVSPIASLFVNRTVLDYHVQVVFFSRSPPVKISAPAAAFRDPSDSAEVTIYSQDAAFCVPARRLYRVDQLYSIQDLSSSELRYG